MKEIADVDAARRDFGRATQQIDKLVMAIADGADALPLNAKIKELEARQSQLQDRLDHASDPEPLIHPNLAKAYRAKVEDLSALLVDPRHEAEAFDIMRGLLTATTALRLHAESETRARCGHREAGPPE